MDDLGKDNNFTVTVHLISGQCQKPFPSHHLCHKCYKPSPNATRVAGYFLCGNPTLS